jgi:hypothetical protein
MHVNADADREAQLLAHIARLQAALRPFVSHARGYSSGIARDGERWCAPRVTVGEMDEARSALAVQVPGVPPRPLVGGFIP